MVITLTTDFGVRDWFVGTMKGVMLRLNPKATIVDLTHEIPPGDIRSGAFALAACYSFFPKGTIHVAVVDPGVGSKRKAIAVRTANYSFVGPDNGLLSWALAREKIKAVHSLQNGAYFLPEVSGTFHGRDIFAPVAAHLSRGLPNQKLGPRLEDFVRLDWPETRHSRGAVQDEIVYIDRFGNAITNLDAAALRSLRHDDVRLFRRGKPLCLVAEFYQAVSPGEAVAVPGSSGFLEIAINGGNAARRLRLRPGDTVTVRRG
jgi:S-adenosylmethionine hydrolase